jgi:hypothetical protein
MVLLLTHVLSEVAAAKLGEIGITTAHLDAAADSHPVFRGQMQKLARSQTGNETGPAAISWADIYTQLKLPNPMADRPRSYVVDYYFGRTMEAHIAKMVRARVTASAGAK